MTLFFKTLISLISLTCNYPKHRVRPAQQELERAFSQSDMRFLRFDGTCGPV